MVWFCKLLYSKLSLWCCDITDDIGHYVMPDHSVSDALMSCVGLTLSFQDALKLSRDTSVSDAPRSPPLYASMLPVTAKFARPCLLKTCPRKASCRWRILFISARCTRAALSTFKLLFFSVHDILSILRKNHVQVQNNYFVVQIQLQRTETCK